MTDTASGRLMFTRPSQMQWTYETPKKRKIAFDGKELTIEEGDHTQRIRDSGRITLEKSFSFLWGKPDADLFLIESKSSKVFIVKPRRPDEVTFTSIVVTVDGGRVSKALITDKLESQSLLEFSQWKTKS